MEQKKNKPPIMQIGKYRGVPIDKLPNSYLKWMLSKDFPEEYLKYARMKVNTNSTSSIDLNVTRHAIDRFSLRYMNTWKPIKVSNGVYEGLASYIARIAFEALHDGKDISKHRRNDDEMRMIKDGITYVFNSTGDYKTLITVL